MAKERRILVSNIISLHISVLRSYVQWSKFKRFIIIRARVIYTYVAARQNSRIFVQRISKKILVPKFIKTIAYRRCMYTCTRVHVYNMFVEFVFEELTIFILF